jgi:hypothetical protein
MMATSVNGRRPVSFIHPRAARQGHKGLGLGSADPGDEIGMSGFCGERDRGGAMNIGLVTDGE